MVSALKTPLNSISLYRNDGNRLEMMTNEDWDFGFPSVFRGFASWLDHDGHMDVIARIYGMPVIAGQIANTNVSLMVSLEQVGPNSSAIGARIWITDSTGITRFRDIVAGSNNIASSSPPMAHFGVGEEESVSMRIRWPNGEITSIDHIQTNRWIHIKRTP